mmetsp:Transcript_114436/g.369889  ORF Transcript_114436/g.369889 Transcript_114436/m.369889 type:complete len:361 (-) Transcript_114436:29-1111(-)
MFATPVLLVRVLSALAFTSQTGVFALCPDGAETCSAEGVTALLQTASQQKGLRAETDGNRFWPKLVVTRAQIEEVADKANSDDLRGLDREQAVRIGSCGLITCMNFLNPKLEVQCAWCMDDFLQSLRLTEVGINHVAFGYVLDMLSLPLSNNAGVDTYIKAWCPEGLATCTVKRDFPGQLTDSFMDWETVWNMGKQYPAKQWSGQWWRGSRFLYHGPLHLGRGGHVAAGDHPRHDSCSACRDSTSARAHIQPWEEVLPEVQVHGGIDRVDDHRVFGFQANHRLEDARRRQGLHRPALQQACIRPSRRLRGGRTICWFPDDCRRDGQPRPNPAQAVLHVLELDQPAVRAVCSGDDCVWGEV